MIEIDWNSFTPAAAISGGVIIGLAATLLLLINGRIAGISGILGTLLRPTKGDIAWRIAFLVGIIGAPSLWLLAGDLPAIKIEASYPVLVAAGLIVGIGTRYGSGCTSGHGVCGISRFSPRSIVATLSFMAGGFFTVYLIRHIIGA